ncbi:MAG: ERAP1-like C-terminal domain-containing protein [Candidatus Obscuribacterales bacterium]|nr:ERAP1-like C-terminal domain-containing protein [Candidatus Obscuribacterales bacterium]
MRLSVIGFFLACLVLLVSLPLPVNCADTAAKNTKSPKSTANQDFRLPKGIIPSAYKIFIEPDLENKQFSGEESVFFVVEKPVDEIILNANQLEIADAELTSVSRGHGEWLSPEIVIDEKRQIVRFRFKKKLKADKYELRLKFAGQLSDKLVGFYYSSYKDDSGKIRPIACTQMEPTDARRVFPCFDEPFYKATFKITLSIDPELTAISNAPVKFVKEDKRRNKKQYTFEETPRMSTYLVAMIVGPFEATESKEINGVRLRTWTMEGKTDQGQFGLHVAEKLLPYFETYFGVKYPLNKLDLIAIPDFGPGAMENLGAITFRETRLLVDEKTASTSAKQDVANVVAHEMAHMWFGDLVTMQWWDDLWLNEAFASWMAVKAVDYFKPEWRVWDSFTSERATAMSSDALNSTRSIFAPVKSPRDAEEMFDEITYEKGASVLLMLEKYLGEEVYRKGIERYIKKHKFKNASTGHLWQALAEQSGKPVGKIMESWIFAPGYPLVTVNEKNDKLSFSQKRFRLLKSEADLDDTVWQIPLTARRTGKNEIAPLKHLLCDRKGTIDAIAGGDSPLLVNAGSAGYYRVKYPLPVLKNLAKNTNGLSVAERYQILSDTWALFQSGDIPISFYLSMTADYKNDNDPNVIGLLISQFRHLDLFVKESSRIRFAVFVRDRLAPLKERLGWQSAEGESDLDQLLRCKVLTAMGTLGQDTATISEARELFAKYETDESSLNPNLYDAIVTIVAYNGGPEDYERLLACFKNAGTAESKVRNLTSLADFRQELLLQKTLVLSLSQDVRIQDAPHLVRDLLSTSAGRHVGWSFVKKHWQAMEERFPVHLFPRVIKGAGSLVSIDDMQDVRAFLENHPIASGKRIALKVVERVKLNAAVNETSGKELEKWLAEF